MSDIQPLKEDVVHAGTLEDPIPQKLIFLKKDSTGAKKVYTLGMGGTTGGSDVNVSNASDTVVGIVKLTDDATLDAPAATGYTALTPNGAKVAIETAKSEITDGIQNSVDSAIDNALSSGGKLDTALDEAIDDALADGGKLDTAIDEAIKDSIADGSLDDAISGAVDDVVQDKIESGEIGGGGDGSSSLVLKPGIIAPLEGASNVSVMVQLQASTFKCLLENEQRKHREFQIATVAEPNETKFTKEVNADTVSVDSQLDPQTQFKWRCRDVTTNGLRSAWTSWTTFTTGNAIQVDTPTVTCSEGTTDVPETPTFSTSAFNITPDQGNTSSQHQSTTWRLLDVGDSNAQVWQSENDTTNKTSITLARGTMQAGKTYIMQAIYNSVSYGSSAAGSVQFTTTTEFTHVATPTITIDGGTVNVGETPVFRGSAFTIAPSGSDTHVSSTWVVTKKSDSSEIYRLDRNSTQKTTMTLPGSLLATSQTYIVSLVYHSQNYGDSTAGTLEFTCADTFKGIKTPTLSLQGANDDGLVDYAASYVGSQFEYIGGIDTCDKVDWELYKGDDKVWEAKDSNILRYLGSFSDYTLEPNTAYVLKYRQHAKTNDVWSSWAELNFTTVNEFTNPTFKFKATNVSEQTNALSFHALFSWWDTSKYHIYKDGILDAELTSNEWASVSFNAKDSHTFEIKRIDGQNKLPYFHLASSKVNIGEVFKYEILGPLPTLYDAEDGEPVKNFAGGFNVDREYGGALTVGPFSKCIHIESLPSGLFKFNPQITNLGALGGGGPGGTGDHSYPNGGRGGGAQITSYTPSQAASPSYGCFAGCTSLTTLPDDLFAYCPNIVNLGGIGGGGGGGADGSNSSTVKGYTGGIAYGCFTNCSSLTSIPESLFAHCPNIVNLGGIGGGGGGAAGYSNRGGNGGDGYGCFTGCTGLTTLPSNLFAQCPNIVNLSGINGGDGWDTTQAGSAGDGGKGYGCFANCTGLTSLPNDLFIHCLNIVNLSGMGASGGSGSGDTSHPSGMGGTGGTKVPGAISSTKKGNNGGYVIDVNASHGNTIPSLGNGIFFGCTNLTTVPQDLFRKFGINNKVMGVNLISTFEGCSQLSATLYFDAENIAQGCVKNFAKGNKAAATVFAKSASTTYNSFHNETTANCNVIPF